MTDSPPSSVSLAVVVQHHPRRAHLLPSLLPLLGECDVVTDPEPDGPRSAIRCYLACLRAMPPWASHLLIVQDDARPCIGFSSKCYEVLAARSDSLVALFLGGAPAHSARLAQQAHRRGEPWVLMAPTDWTPTVALVWPRHVHDMFLAYIEERPALIQDKKGRPKLGDDNIIGAFTTAKHLPVWATVPSLVQHDDIEPSLIGRKASAGRNRFRIAAVPPAELA